MRQISRKQAIAHGIKKYYTGKPCKHGHLSERYTVTCNCTQCVIEGNARARIAIRNQAQQA